MSIKDNSTFKLLKKEHQKSIKTEHRVSNVQTYLECDIIPKGFQINVTPNIGPISKRFQERWDVITRRCSKQLMSLCLSWDIHKLGQLKSEIKSLESSLNDIMSQADLDEAHNIIDTYNMALTNKVNKTQKKKFLRDSVPQSRNNWSEVRVNKTRKPRSRRFKRIKTIARDGPIQTPDVCPVLSTSSAPLSESETSLLSKGLNFCPTLHEVDEKQVREDTRAFFRRLRLKEHFSRKDFANSYDSSKPDLHDLEEHKLYKPKSAPGKCGALESYIDAVESDIEKLLSMPDKTPDNLSKEERSALQSFKNRDDIVIKKADKGSTVVVMDTETYMAEAQRQLSDERFYKKLDSDPTKEFSTTITKTLDDMFEKNEIGINVYETLNPIDCRTGQFYLLPKIQKEGMPGPPIVSAIGHPTEKISEFIDLHLRPHVESLPSYLKDTTDYINKTPSTGLPDHTLLVTMDVTSLYTNIPHDEGIDACREVWDSRSIQVPSTESLAKLLEHVLKARA
ncbi:uncharacterized protein LOC134257802 [Saccostrea cucullata]|uniref:uncharacterized protein LOC134257802 n=1 Tax=Saccostrea cuccullata TaxID=36930 RepID=UPI002ED25F00